MDYPNETHPEYRRRVYAYLGPRRVGVHQRAFAAPPNAIRWTEDDQISAMENGEYFLERHTGGMNRVTVIPMNQFKLTPINDQDVINQLEQGRFYHDPHATKALAFIKQQDQYGFSGAWLGRPLSEDEIEGYKLQGVSKTHRSVGHDRYSHNMVWYKNRTAEERKLSPQARARLTLERSRFINRAVAEYRPPEPELPIYKEHGLKGKPWSPKRRAAHVLNNPNQT